MNISEIQQFLKHLGYYKGVIDGILGEMTKGAVRQFQTNNGLEANGVVGEDLWKMLVSIFRPEGRPERVNSAPMSEGGEVPIMNHPVAFGATPPEEGNLGSAMPINQPVANTPPVEGNNRNDVGSKKYSVVYGDSLQKIANRFGINIDDLKVKNNLRVNSLNVGQILII